VLERLVDILRSPTDGSPLRLSGASGNGNQILTGELIDGDGTRFPIVNGVPRLVPPANYAESFGFQWNRFRRTQLDSHSGVPVSRDRFFRFSGWKPSELRGKRVLDAGCGAGRFAEVALSAGAEVVAIDYSTAVDACWANLGGHPQLHVVQGDIYSLPFARGSFDFVYCFGVLQHTPDVRAALLSLPEQLARGGRLAVDLYWRRRVDYFLPKYWLRPITRRLPKQTVLAAVERAVPRLLPIHTAVGRLPSRRLRRLRALLPITVYNGAFELNGEQKKEWAILDTLDALTPRYDQPQTLRVLRRWLEETGLSSIEVENVGFLVGRARRNVDPRADREKVTDNRIRKGMRADEERGA
jgi:2-polyprenyl-3-methyl-5-hydroxy-6-metoxy-1,4-benzoquinol methylase/uncharacterized protein YbaR (Trm112 family)